MHIIGVRRRQLHGLAAGARSRKARTSSSCTTCYKTDGAAEVTGPMITARGSSLMKLTDSKCICTEDQYKNA